MKRSPWSKQDENRLHQSKRMISGKEILMAHGKNVSNYEGGNPLRKVLDRYRELVAEHERKAVIDQRIIEIMSGEIERLAKVAEAKTAGAAKEK